MNEKHNKKKPKRSWKFWLLTLAAILMIASIWYFEREEIFNVSSILPTTDSILERGKINQGNLTSNSNNLTYNRKGFSVAFTPELIVGGVQTVAPSLVFQTESKGEGFKWGANFTIPNTVAGGILAQNLEEIRFIVTTNKEINEVGGRTPNGFSVKEDLVTFLKELGHQVQSLGANTFDAGEVSISYE